MSTTTPTTTAEFATVLAEWRARHGFTDAEAAAAMGIPYGTFRGWLSQRGLPNPTALAGVMRQVREGLNPMMHVKMSSFELAVRVKEWRAIHRLSQAQAASVLHLPKNSVRELESVQYQVHQPMLGEVLIRLNAPVSEATLAAARKRVRQADPVEVAKRLRAWRRKHKLTRTQAARALTELGYFTTDRTVWVWETARMLPNRAKALLQLLEQPLPAGVKPKTAPHPEVRRFPKLLRAWRKQRGLNQAEACKALGVCVDQGKISRWETGKQLPRLEVVLSLIVVMLQAWR